MRNFVRDNALILLICVSIVIARVVTAPNAESIPSRVLASLIAAVIFFALIRLIVSLMDRIRS